MRLIYMIAADVLRELGWKVEINDKDNYWNLVLTNTTSSMDMPESHKSCLRGLLRGWLMDFNFEGGRQQVNIYKELHGLAPEDDRYSCLDTCVNRTDGNTPEGELNDKEVFVRRKDRFDRYVLAEPVAEPTEVTVTQDEYFEKVNTLNGKIWKLEQMLQAEQQKNSKQKEDIVELLRKSEACIDAVSAMLECSGGATHRMRDFYAEAMRKFIGNAKTLLRSYAEPEPF